MCYTAFNVDESKKMLMEQKVKYVICVKTRSLAQSIVLINLVFGQPYSAYSYIVHVSHVLYWTLCSRNTHYMHAKQKVIKQRERQSSECTVFLHCKWGSNYPITDKWRIMSLNSLYLKGYENACGANCLTLCSISIFLDSSKLKVFISHLWVMCELLSHLRKIPDCSLRSI